VSKFSWEQCAMAKCGREQCAMGTSEHTKRQTHAHARVSELFSAKQAKACRCYWFDVKRSLV